METSYSSPRYGEDRDTGLSEEAALIRDQLRAKPADEQSSVIKRNRKPSSTAKDFSGDAVPMQVKLPSDLVQSLKLHSFTTGRTMSDLVLEALTSGEMVTKAWVATRNGSKAA